MRTVTGTRYVTALREGGSLPGIVEADDLGTYVVKFRGAGHGLAALVAEVVVGELARALDLRTPDLAVLDLDPAIGRLEPDEEVQDLLRASTGTNLAVDFLPGAAGYDARTLTVPASLAAQVVWLDALVLNTDRTWRNPNLLVWGGQLWLIDHGAALYVHHDWSRADALVTRALPLAADHALRPLISPGSVEQADGVLAPLVPGLLSGVLALVPDDWLEVERQRYLDFLMARLRARAAWLGPLIREVGGG